jgi:FAD-linked oxidoreductase
MRPRGGARATWRNWSGNVRCTPAAVVRPRSEDEVAVAIRRAAAAGQNVRVAGSGHSYTEIVSTSGTLLSLERMSGIVSLDAERSEATVWAGTRLRSLGDPLWERGFAMENLGDTDVQALAGAISTATHGSGIELRSLSSQVVGLTVVTATGEVVECSEEREPELFKAARVGLGCLGVITRVRLRLQPRYLLSMTMRHEELETVLGDIHERLRSRHFEFWYWPETGHVTTRSTNVTDGPVTQRATRRFLQGIVLENAGLWLVNSVARAAPASADAISGLQARLAPAGERVDRPYRLLATPRLVKLLECEYAIPAEAGPECLREVKAWIDRSHVPISFPIEYRYVAADDSFLSPYYGRRTVMIDLQQFKGMPYHEYFLAGEEIFRRYEGRPHWGKLHTRTAAELRDLYPEWERFQEVRRRWDPDGLFMNDYLRRVLDTGQDVPTQVGTPAS